MGAFQSCRAAKIDHHDLSNSPKATPRESSPVLRAPPIEEQPNVGRTRSMHVMDLQHKGPDFTSCLAAASLAGVPWKEAGADNLANNALVRMWPVLRQALAKEFFEIAPREIREHIPHSIAHEISVGSFELGDHPPLVSGIDVSETARGLKVNLSVEYESDVKISMKFGMICAGLSWMKMRGDVTLLMEPLVGEMPLVGAVKGYLMDPPEWDFRFSGLAHVAHLPLLKNAVRVAVDKVFSTMLVVPHFQTVQLVHFHEKEQDETHQPLGVLRVQAVSAKGLKGSDWHLFSKSTSDAFLRVRVGDQVWDTTTVKSTCDPKWPASEVNDFVIYDQTQLLSINIFDWDCLNADDNLGEPEKVQVNDSLKVSDKSVPVYKKTTFIRRGANSISGPEQGQLVMRYTWLNIETGSEARRRDGSGEGYVLIADVDRLTLPASLAHSVQVRFAVAGRRAQSRFVRTPAESIRNAVDAVDKVVRRVVEVGAQQGLSHEALSEMTGLSTQIISHILQGRDGSDTDVATQGSLVAASVKFDAHLAIPLKVEDVQHDSEMEVQIRDRTRNVVAHTIVRLSDVPLMTNMSSNIKTMLELESESDGSFALEVKLRLHELKPGPIGK
mmetsp:Transcript_109595/g.274560  ORF Transcript_109595/g.274560 Transcript_109595/m.274560 type:complete len:612 (-) Transcript_109595:15-1850(-)|eukprot:CAMPEP_0115224424 /NCGR_PEP_ID=MMETSP0270-20121206/29565_1 /TAXON_ID=71861 /ORGANISM="Scrippsiella trochoidea, Strain CCMP3099" /LENGTH=611 /DNA_ID=CAMNT_0002638729 /DNA_START=113 /DNA_END=1948 /DNA_ORIENTATION=+